jgi:uncharacterized membrane-anchored protein YhcB (DUF1043 family)
MLESAMGTLAWAITTVIGLLIGAGIGFWIGKLHNAGNAEKIKLAEHELADYRAQVSEHFRQSATHFHAIGEQYRELYEHMAAGSKSLCSPDVGSELEFPKPAAAAALTADVEPEPDPEPEAIAAAESVDDDEPADQLDDETKADVALATASVADAAEEIEEAHKQEDDGFDGTETIATTAEAVEAADAANEADDTPPPPSDDEPPKDSDRTYH